MNFFELEQLAMKRARGSEMRSPNSEADVSGLTAMLDYAIMEGAQMRLPLFVCLLRLARMALKEETEGTAERKPEVNA